MRSFLYLATALSVIALAAWAYRENHLTQTAMTERRALEREMTQLRQALSIQRAEWAWLNRPDRLRSLVEVNFERLKLIPMTAEHFGEIGLVAYPLPPTPIDLDDAVEVFGAIETLSYAPQQEDPL